MGTKNIIGELTINGSKVITADTLGDIATGIEDITVDGTDFVVTFADGTTSATEIDYEDALLATPMEGSVGLQFPNWGGGTLMVTPSTGSVGTAGSIVLQDAGLYEVAALVDGNSYFMFVDWDGATPTFSTPSYFISENVASIIRVKFGEDGVVSLVSTPLGSTTEIPLDAQIYYRKLGAAFATL